MDAPPPDIPAIDPSPAALANMHAALDAGGPLLTEAALDALYARLVAVPTAAAAERLGVQGFDPARCALFVTDPDRPIGTCRMQCFGTGNRLIVDNREFNGVVDLSLRFTTSGAILLAGGDPDILILEDVYLRGEDQWLFWGSGSTSVGTKIEIEGSGLGVAVGDDCMFSSSTCIRNHDMHTLVDLAEWRAVNRAPRSVIFEQHVWLGDGVLLVNPGRIGFGSVAGARSFVSGEVAPMTVVAGTPARRLRENASWDRQARDVADETKARLLRLAAARDGTKAPT